MGRLRKALGFVTVCLTLIVATWWCVSNTSECFVEGWYKHTLVANLALMFGGYLLWPLLFVGLGVLASLWPRVGAIMFAAAGILTNVFMFRFPNLAGLELILLPCLLLAAGFLVGEVPRPKLTATLTALVPLAGISFDSIPNYWLVSHRLTKLPTGPLGWKAGDQTLFWAPPGPGWPNRNVSYAEAQRCCDFLDQQGTRLLNHPVRFWRLPTVQETVAALNRGGVPAGCAYYGAVGPQPCDRVPDKEAPLWDPFSPVIRWWTASSDPYGMDLVVTYNGIVAPSRKSLVTAGFRAVHNSLAIPLTR